MSRSPHPILGSRRFAHRLARRIRRLSRGVRSEAGFTLVEVIVAVAILSIGLGVLLGSISSGLRRTAEAERMADAGSLAQTLIAEVGADTPIRLGESAGEFPNGYRWRLNMRRSGNARESELSPIIAYEVTADVTWDDGVRERSYTLTTLRLGPRETRR